jgi:hypothetical protein
MELRETLIGLAVCAAVLGFALFQDRRPWQPGKRDWVPLMILALIGLLVLAGHLVALVKG